MFVRCISTLICMVLFCSTCAYSWNVRNFSQDEDILESLRLLKNVGAEEVFQNLEENSVLNVKRFDTLSEEWLEFIKENRSKGGLQHNYDVVIGPVADDNTMEIVQLYIANILTASEAVERLRYNKVNNQVSFHTEKALQYLQLVRRTSYARNDL